MQRSTQTGQQGTSNKQKSDSKRPYSQSTESTFDSMDAPSVQASSGLGVVAVSKSSESRSGAINYSDQHVNSSESGTSCGQRGDEMDIDSNNEKGELDSKL